MALKLITAPATTPVSLLEVKRHLQIDTASQDENLNIYIAAATANLDGIVGWLGRALVSQTWDLYYDEFPCGSIKIPLPPLISVTSVNYVPADGVEVALSTAYYTVDSVSVPGWIVLNSGYSWPTTLDAINTVRIRFVAGYSTVPAPIKAALLLMVGAMMEKRESLTTEQLIENPTLKSLLMPYWIPGF